MSQAPLNFFSVSVQYKWCERETLINSFIQASHIEVSMSNFISNKKPLLHANTPLIAVNRLLRLLRMLLGYLLSSEAAHSRLYWSNTELIS